MFKYILLMLLALPAFGDQYTSTVGKAQATYSASANVTVGSSPTDICVLGGSATKKIKVHQVQISTVQGTAGSNRWFLVKRSNKFPVYTTQGTTMTGVPLDLQTVSSTASAITLSSNASSLGTLVGNLRVADIFSPVVTTASPGAIVVWDFDRGAPTLIPIALNNATDTLAVNFNGASLPSGLILSCNFVWTEE